MKKCAWADFHVMASGGDKPYRNSSFNHGDFGSGIRRRQYSDRETSIPSKTTAQHSQMRPVDDDMSRKFSQVQISDDETNTQTHQHLAQLQAEIAAEEDSATVVRNSSPREGTTTREQIQKSEEKLRIIRTRKGEITQLFKTIKRSQTVDLCFFIDCTGSMDPYIDQVKTKIEELVAHCKMTFADLVLKVAFVGYRDHNDEERITSLSFTDDIAHFKSFVSDIQAYGGDDAAEDVFGGLERVGELEWSAPNRILFHVADAPCHGRQYHDGVRDNFPNGDPRGLHAQDLLKILKEKKVKYWFAKLTDKTDKMIAEFTRLLGTQMFQQVKLESAEQLMFVVADSVSSSINDMETATLAAAALDAFSRDYNTAVQRPRATRNDRSLKTFTICQSIPNWGSISAEYANMFRNKLPKNMDSADLKQPLQEECRRRKIQITAQPFAEGTQRIVYYGIDCTYDPPKKVVFKEFKYLGDGLNKLKSYKQQMEVQSFSAFLAREFNKKKPNGAKEILFTKVVVIGLHERPRPFYCSQEPLIEGPYIKYNSNNGFVNKDEYTSSLNAFSHWTHQITNGYLMVVDLQGVKITSPEPKFILTDPALHCKDLTRFCSTNLGNDGMHRFFRTHYCNTICRAMNLKPHRHQPKPSTMIGQGTTALVE